MKLSLISKRNKRIFESKINQKSRFLRSLPQRKYEGIKKVEEGKTELIIDKILGIGEFERDYAFFSNNKLNEKPDNNKNKNNINPSLMNRISDLVKKDSVDKYEQLNENTELYEKKFNSFREEPERKYNNANKYWRINKQTKAEKENEQFESFFSKMGNKVIINKLNSNQNEKNPLYNSENTNPRKKYKKIYFY
jgi:hypothetical protein